MVIIVIIFMFPAGCEGGFTCEGECGQDGDVSPDTEQDLAADTDEEDRREDDGEEAADAPEVTEDAVEDPLQDEDAPEDIREEEEIVEPPPVYSFIVYGDNQFATSSCTSGVPERMAIPEAILELDPTFILHTGDLMDHAYDDGAYDAFVGCYSGMLAAIPFFPTMGNHDAGSGGIWNYKAFVEDLLYVDNPAAYGADYDADFEIWYEDDPTEYSTDFDYPTHRDILPSGVCFKTNYAFKYANAYFISFEIGTRWWTNTPTTWVETHLDRARSDPSVRHVIATMHHPMYSTTMAEAGDGDCLEPVRRHYEDLFRLYDVTLVFSGHAHVYDRFLVPDDGSASRARPSPGEYEHDGEGVHYIVTGGGGGPLPNNCSPPPGERDEVSYDYSQQRGCGYHVTLVEVDGDALQLSIIGVQGSASDFTTSVWDTFTIQ